MDRTILISDMHGCASTFRTLVKEKVKLTKKDALYLLGDYINKGPDSKGVLDYIFSLKKKGFEVKCLRGNHEQYLLDGLGTPWDEEAFVSRGGKETLESFGVKAIDKIPSKYLDFIQALPFYFELENYLLIHAGLDFAIDDPFVDSFSMLNIRDMKVDMEVTGGRRIIHGHVPTPLSEIKDAIQKAESHISIDAGCVYTDRPGMAHLVALDLVAEKLFVQENTE